MVLKLAFTDRITYHRNQGARTTKIALPFKALGSVLYREISNGAADRTRTYYPIITNDVLYLMSYSGFLLFPRPDYGPTSYCEPYLTQ